MGIIYLITNIKNNKKYVGQHNEDIIDERWRTHKGNARRDTLNYDLYIAMRKDGIENFTIETLCIIPNIYLNVYEAKFAEIYNTYSWNGMGYNMKLCGIGSCAPITEVTREKLRTSHLGKSRSEKSIRLGAEAVSEWASNNPEKVAERSKKCALALEGRSNANWGSHTPAANAKIASTLRGKPKTTEHNLNVMSSEYHTTPGKSGLRYISENEHGYFVRINNKKYGSFQKQFATRNEAINARNNFINKPVNEVVEN